LGISEDWITLAFWVAEKTMNFQVCAYQCSRFYSAGFSRHHPPDENNATRSAVLWYQLEEVSAMPQL
jgi:hypothetical protein